MTFESIFSAYQKMVFNLALHYVQQVEDAEEITQDVFVKVHQNLNSFQGNSDMSTWIYRIAINQSLDFIKAKQSQKRSLLNRLFSLDEIETHQYPVNVNHPGVVMEQKEAYDLFFKALNLLPANQKTALILLKIEQKSQKETAEIMGLNIKALESLFHRAKINLELKLKLQKGLK